MAIHEVRGLMPYDPQHRDLAATREMIASMIARPQAEPGWRQFAVLLGERVVGDIGVNFDVPAPRQAELGFALHPDVRGRGFATEAVGAIVERLFGIGGLHRIEALTDARNLPTQRLLERMRFRREAHYVESWQHDDGWSDEYGYARLARE